MRDEIIKIINNNIDEKEKSSTEYVNQKNAEISEVMKYFSKVLID